MNLLKSIWNRVRTTLVPLISGSLLAVLIVVISFHMEEIKHSYIRYIAENTNVKVHAGFNQNSGGTGFHVRAPSGNVYILTNYHVCAPGIDKGIVGVVVNNSKRMIPRRILDHSARRDLCLLEAMPEYEGFKLASSVEIGERAYLAGYPLLAPMNVTEGEVANRTKIKVRVQCTSGRKPVNLLENKDDLVLRGPLEDFIRSILIVCMETYDSYQITATGYGGNSGSPVLNSYGNVIGVFFAGLNGTSTFGYMLPLDSVKKFLAPH